VKLLLDSHLLIWTSSQSTRLSAAARALLGASENVLVFSAASLWELAIKHALGRDDVRGDPRVVRRALLDNGYEEMVVRGDHAVAVLDLPLIHRDPFDRLLIAQAMVEGITLVTADAVVARYPGPIRKV
jgi:PIN domain nuclease of toxin-antitoxin system